MIWLYAYIGLSALCALIFWASCAAGATAERNAWRHDLDALWPVMPELDGNDLFLEQCGPPIGGDKEL